MTRLTDLDWEGIKTFTVVAGAGTVRSAARELNIHHSTVSRRIESLESDIGTRLFDRRPEGYALTPAGEELVDVAREFTSRLLHAERQIVGQDAIMTGTVTVTMAEPMAVYTFAPRLAEFMDLYPGLELQILATGNLLDVSRREADIAIRMDNNPPETLVGKRLFAYYQTVYANPDYLAARDLKAEPHTGRWLGWTRDEGAFPPWTQETEFPDVPVWGYFPEISVQQAAARHGLGLTVLPCILGDKDPHLVRATSEQPKPSRDVWLLTHADLRRTARIQAFMGFAEKVLRAEKAAFQGDV